MYEYVKKAVDDGDVLLEWDSKRFVMRLLLLLWNIETHTGALLFTIGRNGPAPKPLLKDVFATERRRAKILNFSIAYGKTVHGMTQLE